MPGRLWSASVGPSIFSCANTLLWRASQASPEPAVLPLLSIPVSSVENRFETCGVSWVVDSVFPLLLLNFLNCQLNMDNVFQESRNSCLPIPWNMNINTPWNDDRITNAYVTKGFGVNVEIPARSQQNPNTTERETAARRLDRTMFASRWETWIISRMIRLKKTILMVTKKSTGARKLTRNPNDVIQHLKQSYYRLREEIGEEKLRLLDYIWGWYPYTIRSKGLKMEWYHRNRNDKLYL